MKNIILAQVTDPTPDAGPFEDLGNRILGLIAWLVPLVSLGTILVVGAMFAIAYLDTSKDESAPKKALGWAIVGGGIASSAALIVNWMYGT